MPKEKTSSTSTTGSAPTQDVKILAAIGYLWILCLLPLLGKKDSEFAQFHGKQGLVLTIASFIIWLVAWVPVLGWLVGFFGTIAVVVLAITGIRYAMEGTYWEMPVLGKYAEQIKL